jgi:hypothetical protein
VARSTPASGKATAPSASISEDPATNGRDFYVSPSGSNDNTGMSPDDPWQTLAKAMASGLLPGDRVHLEGGAVFPEPLAPWAETRGEVDSPIVFDSYGEGRATIAASIFLKTVSNLTFENLDVAPPTGKGVFSSAAGEGAQGITLRDLDISNTTLTGITSDNPADDGWLIQDVSIHGTGDSGIFFRGSHFVIEDSTIVDTGLDTSIRYPRHGIYASGPDATIVDNEITRFSASGISLRFQNSLVEGNRISSGAKGISFDNQATAAGVTVIHHNTISDVSDSGIVVATPASESFVVANNTIVGAATYGIYVQVVPALTLANNIVEATSETAALLNVRPPSSSYSEHHNLWHGGSSSPFFWNGSARTFLTYQSLSGQGESDSSLDPLLDVELGPVPGSPAVDAGATAVHDLLGYAPKCDGAFFDYCGSAPDLGSVELPTPTIVSAPELRGSTIEGAIMMVTRGWWSGSPTAFSYSWERCTVPDGPCESIAGANGRRYTLSSADVGSTVRAIVTAANTLGATAATSDVSSMIDAVPEPVVEPVDGPGPGSSGNLASSPSSSATRSHRSRAETATAPHRERTDRVRRESRARERAVHPGRPEEHDVRVLHPRRLDPLDRESRAVRGAAMGLAAVVARRSDRHGAHDHLRDRLLVPPLHINEEAGLPAARGRDLRLPRLRAGAPHLPAVSDHARRTHHPAARGPTRPP